MFKQIEEGDYASNGEGTHGKVLEVDKKADEAVVFSDNQEIIVTLSTLQYIGDKSIYEEWRETNG